MSEKCAVAAVSELLEFEPQTFEPQKCSECIKNMYILIDFGAGEGGSSGHFVGAWVIWGSLFLFF